MCTKFHLEPPLLLDHISHATQRADGAVGPSTDTNTREDGLQPIVWGLGGRIRRAKRHCARHVQITNHPLVGD